MQIREERPEDIDRVRNLHRSAFGEHGGPVAPLVDDLRRSLDAEPGLSLVACAGEVVVGQVLFTQHLLDAPRELVPVQVLSPLAVLPGHQRQGIGAGLVRHGIATLAKHGVPAIFLEGAPTYYPRFGFVRAGDHGFRKPSLRIPDAAFQVCLLTAYEPWMTGTLVYRQTFWDHDAVGLRDS